MSAHNHSRPEAVLAFEQRARPGEAGLRHARPGELREVAGTAFRYKGTTPQDPELKALAAVVTDELDRSMRVELPPVLNSRPIAMSTFMLFRRHIPGGVLDFSLFPVLVHPSTPAVMIVPFEFWPMELMALWKTGRLG